MKVEWSGRSARLFAEVADVLPVTTEEIIGAVEDAGRVTVLYTPELDDPDTSLVWYALLKRKRDRTLKLAANASTGQTFTQWLAQVSAQNDAGSEA